MKKIIFLFTLVISGITLAQVTDRNLLYVDNQGISIDDFLSIYNKNREVGEALDPKTLDEYLDLFINFKLKVREAESLGMDTIPSFIKELGGYRSQLATPYLVDNEAGDRLVKEAYNRMKQEIKASHILISVAPDASPKDSLEAFKKIKKIRNEIISGANFNQVAMSKSQDPSAKENAGDLGYFSALYMVYSFENAAYKTKVGDLSEIVRTRFGYHVIKVTGKRTSRGELKTAHIMVKFPKPSGQNSQKDISVSKVKANEIYQKITQDGADFSEMAKQYSDDKNNASKGGELPWFGSNRMVESYENAAFALQNRGDITAPVQTPYGWHIIRLIDKKGLGTFEEEKEEIKAKVEKDSRSQMKRTSLVNRLKKEYNCITNFKAIKYFKSIPSADYISGEWTCEEHKKELSAIIMTLDNRDYSQLDFGIFLTKTARKYKSETQVSVLVDEAFNSWSENIVIDYENSILESKYNEFRLLMQEYRDGILLYELTDEKIWSKAINDTTGLKQFYELNKNNFMWGTRVQAKIINCLNPSIALKVKSKISKGQDIKKIQSKINKNSPLNMNIEEGIFLKGDNIFVDQVEWEIGVSNFITDKDYTKLVLIESILQPIPKLLSEAKGLITSKYQDFLEEKWLFDLRNKYQVKLDDELWSLLKSNSLDKLIPEIDPLKSIDSLSFENAFKLAKQILGVSKAITFSWNGKLYTTEQK
jgi:peptidyl-prolyl cis-trans isomerase SurA